MISESDIRGCAIIMLERYGDAAYIEAARRAGEYEVMGERGAQIMWRQIAQTIDELRREQEES